MKNALLYSIGAAFLLSGIQLFSGKPKSQTYSREIPEYYIPPTPDEPKPNQFLLFGVPKEYVFKDPVFDIRQSRYQKRRWTDNETPNPNQHTRNPRNSRRSQRVRTTRR